MRSGGITLSSGEVPRLPRRAARLGAVICSAIVMLSAIPSAALAVERMVYVTLDRAQVMPFPADTETVVVGNPIIADVTMLKNTGQIILTGRGYGETNLVFLDRHGAILSEAKLKVREALETTVIVQRGMDRESYACQPRCQPTVSLGDSSNYLQKTISDIQARNGLASGAAAAAAAPSH